VAPVKRLEDEPPSGGWDAADTVSSFPEPTDLPEPTPRNLPPTTAEVAPPAPAAPAAPAMRARYETSPGVGGPPAALPATGVVRGISAPSAATQAGLATGMREEVWAIVRAAVEEAMGPLVARQRELVARVERAERERDAELAKGARAVHAAPAPALPAGPAPGSAASKLASIGPTTFAPSSIPVAFGPSVAPPTFTVADAAVPTFEPATASATIPDIKMPATASAHPVGPRPSLPPTGYGVTVTTSPRASLDLEAVGPVDIEGFDGGRRKKRVAGVVVVMILLLIAGLVTMTALSHS
jgi:hypothetical protein